MTLLVSDHDVGRHGMFLFDTPSTTWPHGITRIGILCFCIANL